MIIEDLKTEDEPLFCVCLEDWSDELKEAGDHKARWCSAMKDKGLRVKVARDDQGVIGGMIQYLPIEWSPAEGADLYMILCIWVHGYDKGRGNFQKKGMGRALLRAAEEDVIMLGGKGMVAWGLMLPIWMRASWFKRQGYKKVDRVDIQSLLWKPFTVDALPPRWIKRKKIPEAVPGAVQVSAFVSGWCPAQNMAFERAKRAAAELGDRVKVVQYDSMDRAVVDEWGMMDALFIDRKEVRTGPPPPYDTIKRAVEKRLKKLGPPG